MPISKISSVKFCGVSACVPKKILKITDYAKFSQEKVAVFSKQTGIVERRHADNGITASDMCFEAAQKLLEELKWDKSEISALVYASQSPDYPLPATACILQDRLGLPKSCLAFDISLGCSGYVYGLTVLSSMASAMKLNKVLLLAGENTIMQHHPENSSAYPLFGDAGSATALMFDETAPDIFSSLNTDGSGAKYIIRRRGGVREPIVAGDDSFDFIETSAGAKYRLVDCYMDGGAIMDFTLREIKPCIKGLLETSGLTVDDFDAFYTHQANKLINETVRKMNKISPEKYPYNIEKFGNTSVASIPLNMVTSGRDKLISQKQKNMFLGFGVGLSWGGVIVDTDSIVCPSLIEI